MEPSAPQDPLRGRVLAVDVVRSLALARGIGLLGGVQLGEQGPGSGCSILLGSWAQLGHGGSRAAGGRVVSLPGARKEALGRPLLQGPPGGHTPRAVWWRWGPGARWGGRRGRKCVRGAPRAATPARRRLPHTICSLQSPWPRLCFSHASSVSHAPLC